LIDCVLTVVDRDRVRQLSRAVRLALRSLAETDQRKYRIRFATRTSLLGYSHKGNVNVRLPVDYKRRLSRQRE